MSIYKGEKHFKSVTMDDKMNIIKKGEKKGDNDYLKLFHLQAFR